MSTKYTLAFEDISAADLPLVGGKGANLGEMKRAGFPVPPGFCLTTFAFREFMSASGDADQLYQTLASLKADDVEGVRRAGKKIRSKLRTVHLPPEVATAAESAWKKSGDGYAYAVRSSATAEDLPSASFAGQQDTYLNIVGEHALLASVRDCWISLFTDRAILYRAQNGFDHSQVSLSVVVQRMVDPEVAGILFTADPATGNRQILTIDASYGLGEALVAGLVSADLYRVDKRNMQLIESKIGEKQLAIRAVPGGGTMKEDLPEEMRKAQALDHSQIVELARIGRNIEQHYGFPQDIEWVYAEGEFYIVQSRPITSLFPIPEPQAPGDALRVYFSASHAQVMTDVISPMGISILRLLLPFGKPAEGTGYRAAVCRAGGRLYVDISPLLYHPRVQHILPRALTVADELAAQALVEFVKRPAFADPPQTPNDTARLSALFRTLAPLAMKAMAQVWLRDPDQAVDHVLEINRRSLEVIEDNLNQAAAGLPRLLRMREEIAVLFLRHAVLMVPYIAAAMMSKTLLERIIGGRADPQDIQAVYRGLRGNVTTEMDLQVGDLADIARKHPQVQDLLLKYPAREALDEMSNVSGGAEFVDALDGFLKRYGGRGPSEIDIARLRWWENPAPLLQVIAGNLTTEHSGGHRRRHQELAEAGEAAVERLAAIARYGLLGPLRAAVVRRLGRVARGMFAVREHPKYMMIRALWMAKQIIKEAGSKLVEEHRLMDEEDVWLLQLHELIEAFERPELSLGTLIADRRVEQSYFQGLIPPRLITSDGEIIVTRPSNEDLPPGALGGSPVSGGVVEGVARVVLDPSTQVLQPGEILVAPFTDPGWTPLFINAAGLVMEVGGLMTHGSVVAREYGLPAVVGVPEATRRIKTGQRIRVDGDGGYVEILDGAVRG